MKKLHVLLMTMVPGIAFATPTLDQNKEVEEAILSLNSAKMKATQKCQERKKALDIHNTHGEPACLELTRQIDTQRNNIINKQLGIQKLKDEAEMNRMLKIRVDTAIKYIWSDDKKVVAMIDKEQSKLPEYRKRLDAILERDSKEEQILNTEITSVSQNSKKAYPLVFQKNCYIDWEILRAKLKSDYSDQPQLTAKATSFCESIRGRTGERSIANADVEMFNQYSLYKKELSNVNGTKNNLAQYFFPQYNRKYEELKKSILVQESEMNKNDLQLLRNSISKYNTIKDKYKCEEILILNPACKDILGIK